MAEILGRVKAALAGLYDVELEIGRGGASTVFRARDLRHERDVAIKVLSPVVWSELLPDRFLREISIAGRLSHPNILPLFDSGEADGLLYYVMPFVEGESLRDRLIREGPLPVEDAVELVAGVADALQHAHAQGVVHRDIKPGNILLLHGSPVVADFGIAQAVDHAADAFRTTTGHVPGTPAYMSPEQAGGQEVDARSDLYSLGCLLYETLAGEPPFSGRTALAVVAKHMSERPPSLEVVRPAVPGGLVDVLEKSLQKVPADRFQTAEEFRVAVRGGLNQRLRKSDDPGVLASVRRRPRAAVAALASVAALIVWGSTFIGPTSPQLDDQRVVVFPLVLSGQADVAGLGWDVALAIGSALEHTEPLTWSDGWQWLPEEVRGDARRASSRLLGDISRSRGAARYVSGVIRPTADSTAVVLRLHASDDGRVLGQETVWGLPGTPVYEAGLGALLPLLTQLLEPGRAVDLSPLTDRKPAAVLLSIQGDRAYRQSNFGQASQFYRRALEADSLLVFAAAKGATALVWEDRYEDALDLSRRAVAHDSLLPPRYRHFARGVNAYLEGQADSAVHHLTQALRDAPDWLEAEGLLGETFYHLLPNAKPMADPARVYFERVMESDPSFTPPMIHVAEITIRAGEVDQARRWVERLRDVGDEGERRIARLGLTLECVSTGGLGHDRWQVEADLDVQLVLDAAVGFAAGGAYPTCAEEAFRAAYSDEAASWGALLGLQSLMLAQGRLAEAEALLDSALTRGIRGAYSLYLFDSPMSARFDEGSQEAEQLARDPSGVGYVGSAPTTPWLIGLWLAQRGDSIPVKLLEADLKSRADGPRGREARLLSSAVAGHLALSRGETDEAVRVFEELSPTAPPWRLYWELHEALAIEKILLARALLARGDNQAAHDVAATFDHGVPITYLAYLAPSLEIRRRAAEALGKSAWADEYRIRLLELGWPNGEVPLSLSGRLIEFTP